MGICRMKSLSIILVLVLSTVAGTIWNTEPSDRPDDREALWMQVRQAELKGLPKSAAKLLGQIYDSAVADKEYAEATRACLLYTSPSPRDLSTSRMPSSA